MTSELNPRLAALGILLILSVAWIIFAYAKLCLCDNCKDPFAVFGRGDLQFCRSCWSGYRRKLHRVGRRRSLLRRIFRTAR